jgi:hypothetical protein
MLLYYLTSAMIWIVMATNLTLTKPLRLIIMGFYKGGLLKANPHTKDEPKSIIQTGIRQG